MQQRKGCKGKVRKFYPDNKGQLEENNPKRSSEMEDNEE
jgi:hypothetical protein